MADIRIKDLAAFSGTPTATDFLAIDSMNETKKIPGNAFALNSKIDYAINEIKSAPNGTAKIIVSDIPPASIGGTSLGNEEYFKSTLKKLCEVYPNRTDTLFIGKGLPGNFWIYEIFIYNTSIVNSEGLPQYSFGRVFTFGTEYYGSTINHVFAWKKSLNDLEGVVIRTSLDITEDPNPRQSISILKSRDKNNQDLVSFTVGKDSDGSTSLFFGIYNTDTNGNSINVWPRMRLARNGAVYYDIPNVDNFRSAIGLSTTRATFTGDYIQGQWIARKNGNVVTIQTGNFSSVPTGTFRMDGVIPEGFRPTENASFTFVSKEGTPRVFALQITPAGDMVFYNYNAAIASAVPIANVFSYIV